MMRAKMRVTQVETFGEPVTSERVHFAAVSKSTGYPADGSDEDNSYARWSPQADLHITIQNPALFGKHVVDEKYYVDFTKAEK